MEGLDHPAVARPRSLSRRRLLRGAAFAGGGLAGLPLLSCSRKNVTQPGSRKAGSTGGSAATPKQGGTLRVAYNYRFGFDPHVLPPTDTIMLGLVYSTLIRTNPRTNQIEPDLAAKWEAPSQTELVFTLAPNIKWQDKPPANGRPLKIDDIIYSFNRVQTNDPKFVNRSYLAGVDKMEAIDERTLKLTFKQPDVTQLGNVANVTLKILAPEVVDKAGKFATADTAVGTGAFVMQNSEANVGSALVRNPNYFKPGLPYLDRIEAHAFQDDGSEWAAFLAGQLDHRWVPGQEASKFQAEQQNRYSLDWFADVGYDVAMAMVQKKPFDDPRVTRALRLLIDQDEFKTAWDEVWYGRGRFSLPFAAATADVWDLSEDEYRKYLDWKHPKDDAIKEALSMLAAAGFTKDKPLKFTISGTNGVQDQPAMVQLGQAQFRRNGQGVLDPDVKFYDNLGWISVRNNAGFDYLFGGHNPGGVDPDAFFSSTYKTGGGRNYGKMSDPTLDKMFEKQRTLFDEQERKKAVREIVMYMIDHSPYGATPARYVLNATASKIRGFAPEGAVNKFGEHYENIWIAS
jgi:peptide/nickel transport system substrate-binding protein